MGRNGAAHRVVCAVLRRRDRFTPTAVLEGEGEKGEELDCRGPPTVAAQEGRDEDSESVALSAPPDSPGLAC